MPAKNSQKPYTENGYYHIYNRGVEKREIFTCDQDYGVFLSYLKEYLLPKDIKTLTDILLNQNSPPRAKYDAAKALRLNNFYGDITLLAYSLMPNHFHFLVHQNSAEAIDTFMNSLATRYTLYFNRRQKRVGPLYQSVYKAVLVKTEEQLVHVSRYIHRNCLDLASTGHPLQGSPFTVQPSSYPEYLGMRKTEWIHPEVVLSFFSKKNNSLSYQSFLDQDEIPKTIYDLLIDN